MGGGASIQPEIDEAQKIMVDFSTKFALNYSKAYVLGLMKEAKKEMLKSKEEPRWKLLKLTDPPAPPIRKQGILLKRSDVLKKWNPRYFVVRGDWIVDFYENEAKFKSNPDKPRGSYNMTGYRVRGDVNGSLMKRLVDLAEKAKMDISALPKPEIFKDTVLELHHDQKTCYFLDAETPEEHKEWVKMFDQCYWNCSRYNIRDPVHQKAFPDALWRTRWECDMWGWWYSGGGEVAMISDCINDKIADCVLGNVDAKLNMGWTIREKIRNNFIKNVDSAVTKAVAPMWKAAYSGVEASRDKIKEKLAGLLQPAVDAQKSLEDQIVTKIDESSKSTISEKLAPHFSPLLEAVFAPVLTAFKEILLAYDVAIKEGQGRYTSQENHQFMVRNCMYSSEFWTAYYRVSEIYDTLWDMGKVFNAVYPYRIQSKIQRRLSKLLRNALYTFEVRLEEQGKGWEVTAAETRALMVEDAKTAVIVSLTKVLIDIASDVWGTLVENPARKIVAPLADAIPEPVKDFCDPNDVLTTVLNRILWNATSNVVAPLASKVEVA